MKTRSHRQTTLLIVLLVALAYVGCEDSEVTAPSDAQVFVHADPALIVIDEEAGETEGSTTITAQMFNTNGFPLDGISVSFSTTGGTLTSGGTPGQPPQPVESDSNGRVIDVLTLTVDDEVGEGDQVEVTVFSGSLTGSVFVPRSIRGANRLPVANIDLDPSGGQRHGVDVMFDGSGSSDPDGDPITCYKWTILSDDPENADEVVQRQTAAAFSRPFDSTLPDATVTLTVSLQVSDEETDPTFCDECQGLPGICGAADSFFSPDADVLTYEISCDPSPPLVNILTGNTTLLLNDAINNGFKLFATSSDPESSILRHIWSCGNNTGSGSGPVPGPVPGPGPDPLNPIPSFICFYPTRGDFTVTLTVENNCGQTAQDTVFVTVN